MVTFTILGAELQMNDYVYFHLDYSLNPRKL